MPIIMPLVFFIIGFPFVVWFSVELGRYPLPKIPCESATPAYILNGTDSTCEIELDSHVVLVAESCGDRTGLILVNTNCNGPDAVPQYSFGPIISDSSAYRNHQSFAIMLGVACLFAFMPTIQTIIALLCFKYWDKCCGRCCCKAKDSETEMQKV